MNQLGIGCVPAMGELRETGTLKFSPREMQKLPTLPIEAGTRHTGGIDQCCSVTMAEQVLADSGSAFEGMVHVAKNHQIGRSRPGHPIQGEGQVLIAPVDRRRLPIPTAGTVGIGPHPRGTAVGHHDQRLVDGDSRRSLHNPISGRLKRHRSVDRLHGLGQMKPPAGTAGTCTDNGQRKLRPMDGPPGAVKIAEQSDLLLEDPTTAVPPPVMVPQNHRHREGKPRDPARQTQIPVSEITNKENSVGFEELEKLLIRIAPGAMQISGNGKAQMRQSECLGCSHPAPHRS